MKMMVSWSHDLSHVGASDSALVTGYRGLIRRWGHARGEEGSFIFKELESTINHFKAAGEEVKTFRLLGGIR